MPLGYDVNYPIPSGPYPNFYGSNGTSLPFTQLRPLRYGRRNWAWVVAQPPPEPEPPEG